MGTLRIINRRAGGNIGDDFTLTVEFIPLISVVLR